jgi:hypothetical protein
MSTAAAEPTPRIFRPVSGSVMKIEQTAGSSPAANDRTIGT